MQIATKFIANNAVTNAKAAQMATLTVKANLTNATANASDIALGLLGFDAIVGASGTHATINDVIADSNIANIKRVLVVDAVGALNTTQTISVDDIEFFFKQGATYTNGTAGTGLSITGNRVNIIGGRFLNFTTAISVGSTKKNNLLMNIRFNGNTTSISDSGNNTTISNPIEEV